MYCHFFPKHSFISLPLSFSFITHTHSLSPLLTLSLSLSFTYLLSLSLPVSLPAKTSVVTPSYSPFSLSIILLFFQITISNILFSSPLLFFPSARAFISLSFPLLLSHFLSYSILSYSHISFLEIYFFQFLHFILLLSLFYSIILDFFLFYLILGLYHPLHFTPLSLFLTFPSYSFHTHFL